ncbi:MAG: cell division protein FtsZ [Muribaculaceae bacterium]|nr:cell division protein FtsZ [Bacteroidales bacterium]MBD5340996.1 cell division protein FtsZ [Bacteroides sp.]MDE6071488.1 cell division protein FtsZ [Muribaculaceae bacterium]
MEDDIKTPHIYDLSDDSEFVKDENDAIIKVIGVGGGGSNAVNYMYSQHIPYVNFVICNTDDQHLKRSPVPTKLLIGADITKGLGAGNVPEVGKQCAEASKAEIQKLFDDKTEMVFVTAGMGGGTGTGAGPVVAQLSKEAGMLTIGIVTVPFFFEGNKKIMNALSGAEEMKKHVDALLVINNENLIDLYQDLDFFNAFGKADDTLANAARSISEIISEPCYINVDFQDVKTTLRNAGTAIIATAEAEGEHRVTDAINMALHSPLLKTHDIFSSKRILLKFVCSDEAPVMVKEMGEIREFTEQLPQNIEVKWGIGKNPEMGKKVKVTVLASGFDVTLRGEGEKVTQIKSGTKTPGTIDMGGGDADPSTEHKRMQEEKELKDKIRDIYGDKKVIDKGRAADEAKYIVLKPSQFDDYDVIAILENNRTYNRPVALKEQVKKAAQQSSQPKPSTPDRPEGPSNFSSITF